MDDHDRIKELEKEVEMLRKANELLESGMVTMSTGYLAMRIKRAEERLNTASKEFASMRRRIEILESKP